MSMEKHINTNVKSGYFQIKNIWAVRQYLTEYATHTLVNSTVIPKIDYCNALLAECPKYLIKKLQRLQNAAARLVKRVKKRQHITPTLKQLHWLPVVYRIKFKVALVTYKSLNGFAPPYVTNLLSRLCSTRRDRLKLTVPQFNNLEQSSSQRRPLCWKCVYLQKTLENILF